MDLEIVFKETVKVKWGYWGRLWFNLTDVLPPPLPNCTERQSKSPDQGLNPGPCTGPPRKSPNWCSYKRRLGHRYTAQSAWRLGEKTASVSQGERPWKKLTLPTPWSQPSSLQTVRKWNFCYLRYPISGALFRHPSKQLDILALVETTHIPPLNFLPAMVASPQQP